MVANGDRPTPINDPTIKDPRNVDPKSTDGEQNLTKLRAEFENKFGTPVPSNKKNDAAWIASKLD